MAKVILNGEIIAESTDTIQIEGNHYFPAHSIKKEYLENSDLKTTCPWKGVAHYYHLNLDSEKMNDMVWYYPEPKDAAKEIKGRIAFYQRKGLKIVD